MEKIERTTRPLNCLYTAESVQEDDFKNKIVLATKISQNCPVRRIYFTLQVL